LINPVVDSAQQPKKQSLLAVSTIKYVED